MAQIRYKRILLKISGEALGQKTSQGDGFGLDFGKLNAVCASIKQCVDMGVQVGLMVGAGNFWRGVKDGADKMQRSHADAMGMLGTVINCLCMSDALRQAGVDCVVQSAVDMDRFCEPFNAVAARRHLAAGRGVLFAAGSGNPFFSTDTAVALRAVEIQADAIMMAKNIDGVYTADPAKDPTATLIKDITYREALNRGLKVMDAAAFAICAEQKLPMVRVFGLDDPENLIKVLQGDEMGTFVHP